MLKEVLIIILFTNILLFEDTKNNKNRSYQKKLLKHLNKNQFSLVLSYRESNSWFKNLKKMVFKNRLPILFLKISKKNMNHAFNMYQMNYYPNLRFYMGHPDLYVQYMGKFIEKNKEKDEISPDIQNFILERTKKSYSKINDKKTNIKEYIQFLLNQNESFLFYKGSDTKNLCFKLFLLFSKSTNKYVMSHWQEDVYKSNLQPSLNTDNQEIENGFYLYKNYKENEQLQKICSQQDDIKLNKKQLLDTHYIVRENYYVPLNPLKLDDLIDESIKYFFIMNEDFFKNNQQNLGEVTQTYLYNLQTQLYKRMKSFQFYAQKRETQKTYCAFIDSKVNSKEYEYIMNMVGFQNRRNFLYIFKRHSYKPEVFYKYQLDLTDPTKINLNLQKIITQIKRKKFKPFLKSGINNLKEKNYHDLKEVALNDFKPIAKENMAERVLFYCFKKPDQQKLQKLQEYQKQKLLVYLIDMEENEVIQMLEGVKDKDEYYLLKEPMSTEIISASWETVESPYTWQGAGDEL